MPFQPLQRFNGFLDRMVPAGNYGGLLSPADERAAGRDARAILASGLLSAAGPQRTPVSLGQAIGASLPPAMAARDQRAEAGVRNEQLRRAIERESRQESSRAKIGEVLRGMGPEGELLGLLNDVNPGAVSQLMATGLLGGGEERDPTDLQMMDAIGLPRTPEGFAQLQELKGNSDSNELMQQLQLQIQGLQLANMKREQEKEEQVARETRITRENAIVRGLEQTDKIAALTKKLEGTALASGLPASEWRRSGFGALAAVGGALGLDVDKLKEDLTSFDEYKKNLNDQLVNLMSAGTLGQGTDAKLAQYRASLASPDTQPAAVLEIQANIAQLLLDQADAMQFAVPNRDKIVSSIEEMRNYVPPGTEPVVDVPAAMSTGRRAVVRAADIGRMSLKQLEELDPAALSEELREAAAKRWDELNAR